MLTPSREENDIVSLEEDFLLLLSIPHSASRGYYKKEIIMQRTNSMLFANFNQDFTSVITPFPEALHALFYIADVFQLGHVKDTASRTATLSAGSIL